MWESVTTLLTFRDNIKTFLSRYDYIATPVFKFLLALLVFVSLNRQFGYNRQCIYKMAYITQWYQEYNDTSFGSKSHIAAIKNKYKCYAGKSHIQ